MEPMENWVTVNLTADTKDTNEADTETDDNSEHEHEAVEMRNKPVVSTVTENSGNESNREKSDSFSNDVYEQYRYAQFLKSSSKRKIQLGTEQGITDMEVLLAATLIHDALEGRKVEFKTEPKFVRSYTIYKNRALKYILYLLIFVNMGLVFFEKPAEDNLKLDYWITMLVELVCLMYFTFRTCHHAHWRSFTNFRRDVKNIVIVSFILVTVVDMMAYIVCVECFPEVHAIRFSRPLRPFFIVNFSDGRQIRRAWRNIRRTVLEIYHVLVLFLVMILVFAVIGNQLFSPMKDLTFPNGQPYFKSYWECVWELTVLVTTANNPDVMLPALQKSRLYCLYFFAFIVVGYYVLLNVFLAIAYHSYNENMKKEIRSSARAKKRKLKQAFDVIKINYHGEEMVTYRIWKRLMKLVKPKLKRNQVDLLMLILDMNRSGYICKQEFMNVADLLNVPVSEISDRTTWLEKKLPDIYNSVPSEAVKAAVESLIFKVIFDLLVGIQVILIGYQEYSTVQSAIFCGIFSLEILLKLYTFGPMKYMRSVTNWTDSLITFVSIICLIIENIRVSHSAATQITDVVSIIRIFRCIRLLRHIKRFRLILETLVHICRSIFTYCGIIMILFYAFAVLGLELFQGQIHIYNKTNCGDDRLADTPFTESGYCVLNFNNIFSAIMVMATILYENNWHVIADGYALVTNKYARIYFASFYACVVIVLMNIVTAFVVDMFMNEFAVQKEGKRKSPIEEKIQNLGLGIDADTGLEVSAPLTDLEMIELARDGTMKPRKELKHNRNTIVELQQGEKLSTLLKARRATEVPQLSRFDGIRFHIKKSGMRRLEVLLQQLYDVEDDEDDSVDII